MHFISVVGHLAEGEEFSGGQSIVGGQTIKTRTVYKAILDAFPQKKIFTIDTYGIQKKKIPVIAKILKAVLCSKHVVIMVAHNGVKILLPLLAVVGAFSGAKLHYVVIGGWLPEFLEKHKLLQEFAKRFNGIYVETNVMKSSLEKIGITNAEVMPNFKYIEPLTDNELIYCVEEPYKLCTFSRVMKEKGIEDAIEAVSAINNSSGRVVYLLDIYGQIDESQIEWFEQQKSQFPPYIRYCGMVEPKQSVAILKGYYALLFPTYYDGEGFAGTLLDAMASGVPVIASDWRYNAEIVKEGQTGLLFPARDVDALAENLKTIASDAKKWNEMRPVCLQEAQKYLPEEVVKVLLKRIEA